MNNNVLTSTVREVILHSSNQAQVAPSWVAQGAYNLLDPHQKSPLEIKMAALLAFGQIARQELRGTYEKPDVSAEAQHNLFPNLQQRYPVAHSPESEPLYVKLELLSESDIEWNIQRLRKEASSKLRHATALESWAVERGILLKAA